MGVYKSLTKLYIDRHGDGKCRRRDASYNAFQTLATRIVESESEDVRKVMKALSDEIEPLWKRGTEGLGENPKLDSLKEIFTNERNIVRAWVMKWRSAVMQEEVEAFPLLEENDSLDQGTAYLMRQYVNTIKHGTLS